MPNPKPEQVYAAVRSLLKKMQPGMRKRAQALLKEAESGQKRDKPLIRLVGNDDRLRETLNGMLYEDINRTMSGYNPLGGDVDIIASEKYVCPKLGCSFSWRLQQAGEKLPECPDHQEALVPAEKKGM